MSPLTLFGVIAVTLMMIFYALETRSLWWTLAFSISCLGTSVYGFLAGTWPFGVVEFVWCLLALRKWYLLYAQKENIAGKTE
ncbi:hypothetical protein ACSDBR_01445 [Acidithiobacillus ferriphilus]|uniref:hypothetical protein n=1 Tax=Acidithiobacillus ferriphilus TaxID=1689834 RepID=UPI003F5137F1